MVFYCMVLNGFDRFSSPQISAKLHQPLVWPEQGRRIWTCPSNEALHWDSRFPHCQWVDSLSLQRVFRTREVHSKYVEMDRLCFQGLAEFAKAITRPFHQNQGCFLLTDSTGDASTAWGFSVEEVTRQVILRPKLVQKDSGTGGYQDRCLTVAFLPFLLMSEFVNLI